MGGGWLHKGAIICPPCREICGSYFESRKEYCKLGEEPPPPNLYPRDQLRCGANSLIVNNLIYFLVQAISFISLR